VAAGRRSGLPVPADRLLRTIDVMIGAHEVGARPARWVCIFLARGKVWRRARALLFGLGAPVRTVSSVEGASDGFGRPTCGLWWLIRTKWTC